MSYVMVKDVKRDVTIEIELTTMCAVVNHDSVLMINRSKNWKGWAFPGGHIEN